MARKKKETCPPLALWLVTFSDLVTLLLTFFVLLLTMSSMDNAILTRVTLQTADLGLLDKRGSGRVDVRERLVIELMEKPWEVLDKKQRLKDLLFPDDLLPDDLSKAELDKNLEILAKPDGVAMVFTDKLLFEPGASRLSLRGEQLLEALTPVLLATAAPVNVAGHTDASDSGGDPYALSADRALAVLSFLVDTGVPDRRFSLSAYGSDVPALDERDRPVVSSMNRRVEILLKTARPVGGYL